MDPSALKHCNDEIEKNLDKYYELKYKDPDEADKYFSRAEELVKEADRMLGIT